MKRHHLEGSPVGDFKYFKRFSTLLKSAHLFTASPWLPAKKANYECVMACPSLQVGGVINN